MNQGNPTRILAIDLARGLAVSLMILSHGVKGLLSFEQFPSWGLVPIHLITKFSSSIFFLAFGLSLAVSFGPATQTDRWPQKRKKLMFRGLTILFWYKVLTVIEMSHLHRPEEILDALLYRNFPSYAEILGFYALALLWIPFLLPFWQRSCLWVKGLWPVGLTLIAFLLYQYYDFGEARQIKAILVEDDKYYTWGQLSRAPIVFLGMFIGSFLVTDYHLDRGRFRLAAGISGLAGLLFIFFLVLYDHQLSATFYALAENQWKHPPELPFIVFSLSGALGVIAGTILLGEKGAKWLSPFTLIGKETLTAFIFHLTVLFVIYRLLLDLWLKVSYAQALALAVLLIVMTAFWIQMKTWRRNYEGPQVSYRRRARPRHLNSHGATSN